MIARTKHKRTAKKSKITHVRFPEITHVRFPTISLAEINNYTLAELVSHDWLIDLADIQPAPDNDLIYQPFDINNADDRGLVEAVKKDGVLDPLEITLDGFILSGHRRNAAALLAHETAVPCHFHPIHRSADPDEFVRLLRTFNHQRVKSSDERLREELLDADPDEAYESLIEHRRASSLVSVSPLDIIGTKRRSRISDAKQPFLDAIKAVLDDRRKFWPLSDRQVHYALLNDPPLRHANKPDSVYANDPQSYHSLCELLTRARLALEIPFEAIDDETRAVIVWTVHADAGSFIRTQLDDFLKGYWRNLQQSQPNHIEIVAEKNTLGGILRPVAAKYCIPMTTGRGYCSLPPRHKMVQRFQRSGREKLIVLMVSDFDADGEEIAHSFARSLRDDFGVETVHPIKVALTADQVEQFKLPPVMTAKKGSSNYSKFVKKYGDNVFEVEALQPTELQKILTKAIDSVLDIGTFNKELDAEKQDAAFLQGVRRTVQETLKTVDLTQYAKGGVA